MPLRHFMCRDAIFIYQIPSWRLTLAGTKNLPIGVICNCNLINYFTVGDSIQEP